MMGTTNLHRKNVEFNQWVNKKRLRTSIKVEISKFMRASDRLIVSLYIHYTYVIYTLQYTFLKEVEDKYNHAEPAIKKMTLKFFIINPTYELRLKEKTGHESFNPLWLK